MVGLLSLVQAVLFWLLGVQVAPEPQAQRGRRGAGIGSARAASGAARQAAANLSRAGAPLTPQALRLRKKMGLGVRQVGRC